MDDLGDRMKRYESTETSRKLIPLLPIYIRLDGKAFSSFTRYMDKPYDTRMIKTMIETTKYLVKETNACIGYTQSDEISLVIYNKDFRSQTLFDGKIFKITSILASMASSAFLLNYMKKFDIDPEDIKKLPSFDCRVMNLPSQTETANMILWRVQDTTKNAITSAARALYSHKQTMNKNSSEKQEMLFQKGVNFNDYPESFKRGTFVKKVVIEQDIEQDIWDKIPEKNKPETRKVKRNKIKSVSMPIFSKVQNREDVIFEGVDPILKED